MLSWILDRGPPPRIAIRPRRIMGRRDNPKERSRLSTGYAVKRCAFDEPRCAAFTLQLSTFSEAMISLEGMAYASLTGAAVYDGRFRRRQAAPMGLVP